MLPSLRQLLALTALSPVSIGCVDLVGADFDGARLGGSQSACSRLYVSPSGDDASSGCEPARPKRTIGAALAVAASAGSRLSVLVCEGTFEEALTVDAAVELLGGHDCASWQRAPGYGFPGFDQEHETRVAPASGEPALLVTGDGVDGTTTIDGLVLEAPAFGDQTTAARIQSGAAPVFSNNRVEGGATTSATGFGSVGLAIESGAAPDVRFNRIDGGRGVVEAAGVGVGVGRVGVVVDGARPFLRDNLIHGGEAEPRPGTGIGSVGLLLQDADDLTEAAGRPVLRNDIRGGDGDSSLGDTELASIGVLALGATSVDIVSCSVRPGRPAGTAMGLRGVKSLSTGAIRLAGSRVYGGDLSDPDRHDLGFRCAVEANGAKSFVAENNELYGGVGQDGDLHPSPDAVDPGSPSFALSVTTSVGPVIRHNTLFSGRSSYPTVGTALFLEDVTEAVIENNILAAALGWNEPMWWIDCASTGVVKSFRNNLLFNVAVEAGIPNKLNSLLGYGAEPGGTCAAWAGFTTVDALTTHLRSKCSATTAGKCQEIGGSAVEGNLTLKSDCGSDDGCIPWPSCDSGASCMPSLVEQWSPEDNGLSTLFGPGWRLAPGIPCGVVESSLDLTKQVTHDLFGAARTNPPSMGAHELDARCR